MAPSALLSRRRTEPTSEIPGVDHRSILDAARINVMAADRDFRLVYINPCARETLASLDDEIRRSFRIGSDALLGGSIHRMHKDPDRIERLLRDPRSFPHRADIRFGEVVLRATWTMTLDDTGMCTGYVAVWESVARETAMTASLALAATELDSGSETLRNSAARSSDQAGSVAAATEEMSMTAREIAVHTSKAAAVASSAVSTTQDALGVVDRLGRSSGDIVAVLKMITDIAAQTNLLALNATIEAARAGESGRGFAVVAHEVKELARRTAAATSEIQLMVDAIGSDVSEVAQVILDLNAVVTEINELQSSVAAAVEEQSATTDEIAKAASVMSDAAMQGAVIADQLQAAAALVTAQVSDLGALLVES